MFSGDEDYGDEITSGLDHQNEPDDFEVYNQNEADDYRDEDEEPEPEEEETIGTGADRCPPRE